MVGLDKSVITAGQRGTNAIHCLYMAQIRARNIIKSFFHQNF